MGAAVTVTPAPPIAIALGKKTLTVSNVTPSGKVLLLGLDRESAGDFFNTSHYADVQQESGGTGSVTFDIAHGIATHSVWVVADIASGRYGTAAPAGSFYRPLTFSPQALLALVSRASIPVQLPDLALVRPGVGAWVVSLRDPGLVQGAGRSVTLDLVRMRPVGGSPAAPASLALHDLFIGIDPQSFQYFTVEVAP